MFTITVGSPAIPLPGIYQEKTKIVIHPGIYREHLIIDKKSDIEIRSLDPEMPAILMASNRRPSSPFEGGDGVCCHSATLSITLPKIE